MAGIARRHLRADAVAARLPRRARLRRGRVRGRRAGARQRRRDAAHRADRERGNDCRRARRRPHRHGRERHDRRQVARDLRGAGGRRPPHRAQRAREAGDPARSRAAGARSRARLRGPGLQRALVLAHPRSDRRVHAHDPAAGHRRGPAQAVQGRLPRRRPPLADGAARPPHCRRPAGRSLRKRGFTDGAPVVRTVRGRSRCGAVRVRFFLPLRSAAVRRRRARKPGVGRGPRARRRALAGGRGRHRAPGCRRFSRQGPVGSVVRDRRARRRGRPRVRRARARRADRRCRPPAAHRPIAQRTGRRRSAALPEAPRAGDPARHRRCGSDSWSSLPSAPATR